MSILLKRSIIISSIIAVTLNFSSIYGTSYLAYADDNTAEKQTIDENMQQYKVLDDQVMSINSEIAQFDIDISNINSKISETEEQITSTENEISTTEASLEQAEEDLKEKEESLAKRLRAMQKSEMSSNLISYILASDNISDFFSRINAASKVINFDKNLISEINATKEQLTEDMNILSEKKDSLTQLQSENEASLNELNDKKSAKKAKVDELNSQMKSILAVVEENETKLIANSVSIIEDSNSISDLQNAVATLTALIPQLNSETVVNKANASIDSGESKIADLKRKEEEQASSSRGDSTSTGSGLTVDLSSGQATYSMQATAYTGGTFTATGSRPVRDPNGISTIAVDPSVIPLGSKVYVEGYGVAIAADTGGAIKGNIIDVYLNSEAECISWGRRNVSVTILAGPMEW